MFLFDKIREKKQFKNYELAEVVFDKDSIVAYIIGDNSIEFLYKEKHYKDFKNNLQFYNFKTGYTIKSICVKEPIEIFDWQIASILLFIFIILAFVGIHPIITIAIIGDFLSGVNHTLLALTFLMAWSTTVSTSPFSGLNLTVVARYDFSAKEIFKLNIFYAFKMYLICIVCLFILSKYLGL